MIDVGIFDGDLLAVHSTQSANQGDIVVARIDDEVTVKRFRKGAAPHEVVLEAENKDYDPIAIDLTQVEFAIEGLAVGVIRH